MALWSCAAKKKNQDCVQGKDNLRAFWTPLVALKTYAERKDLNTTVMRRAYRGALSVVLPNRDAASLRFAVKAKILD